MATEDDVRAALELDTKAKRSARLEEISEELFAAAYDSLVGEDSSLDLTVDDVRGFTAALSDAIDMTKVESSVELVAGWMETAAYNAAVVAAAPSGSSFTWRTRNDDRVRDLHVDMEGVTAAAGKPFDVGGHPLMYPGQPIGPPEVWINCRCRLDVNAGLAAAAKPEPPRGVVVVARPSQSDAYTVEGGLPADEMHVTLGYYGHADEAPDELRPALESFVRDSDFASHDARVSGVARMGDDDPQAVTLLLESPELGRVRGALEDIAPPDSTHPHFTPHMTLGYGIDPPTDVPASVNLEKLELWWAGERVGAAMDDEEEDDGIDNDEYDDDDALSAAISEEPWSNFSASDYTIEQWRRACLIKMPGGDPESKSTYKVPVLTPSGAVSRAGVHAAAAALAGARGGVNAPAEQKAKAKSRLRGLYSQLKEEPPDSLKAAGPVNTHDAPGWLTHPRETQRLRTYWTKGEGALKIRWGQPGDFDRCRSQLRKYIHNPQYLDGTCANLHHVALGFWPNQGPHAGKRGRRRGLPGDASPETRYVFEAFAACAMIAAVDELPPIEWFQDPGFDGPTPLTVTSDGRVMGHLATWNTCHVGFGEKNCVTAPKSEHDYAYFRTGEVQTAGGAVAVGNITMSTGHAGTDLGPTETVRHYDDTGTVVADVAAGEDEHGIWVAGQVRPGASEEQVRGLRAGALSGDWRRIGGNLELVGALVVNVPGFPIPRTQMAASAANPDTVLALVAAAIVEVDPNALDAELIAVAVVNEQERRQQLAARRERATALVASMRAERARKLLRSVPEKVDA